MSNLGWIYKITNMNNSKCIVGKTEQKRVEYRWQNHKKMLRGGYHYNKPLQAAWNKDGEKSFLFEVIDIFDPEFNFDLGNLEKYWIKTLDSRNPNKGYNLTDGGDGGSGTTHNRGRKQNALVVEERSRKLKLWYLTEKGIEQRKLMSLRNTGRKHSEETKRKNSESKIGIKRPAHVHKALNEGRRRPIIDSYGVRYNSTEEAAKLLKIKRTTIKEILSGRNKKTRSGISFKFINSEV